MQNQQDPSIKSESNREFGWEREIIEKLALAAVKEQTKARRWNVFFKSLFFVYLFALFGISIYPKIKNNFGSDGGHHTAVINVSGVIAEDKDANAIDIIKSLREAVKDNQTKGIILHSNSPGGSPVQSNYVYEEIRNIKKEHPNLPIYAVVSDICASGCYYIASASDKIFVNPSSLIGSIGVIMEGFGFVDIMQKVGVERRLITAGTHKAMLDPFSPPKNDETIFVQDLLNQVHQQFITAVKTGRGDRLKETPDMFSGLVWTGEASIKLGVADAYGNDDYVAKNIIGAEKLVNYKQETSLLDKMAGKLGASFGNVLGSLLVGPSLR
ncbi:MAG: signal peptide peptidase SppA [Methylococcales bacterium]